MIQQVAKGCVLLFVFNILPYVPIKAQNNQRKQEITAAQQAIQDLKNGALVVRLKSKNNKIQKLEALIASPDVKASQKDQLRKELKATVEERNKYNIELTRAMTDLYTFSKVYFIYDTNSKDLKNGTKSDIFLNENLESDPAITLKEASFFVLKSGTTDSNTTTGLEALVIMDDQLRDLKRPFPYYVRINSIQRLFVRVFNSKKLVQKDAKKIVAKLDNQLKSYYQLTMNPTN